MSKSNSKQSVTCVFIGKSDRLWKVFRNHDEAKEYCEREKGYQYEVWDLY